nr:hypothetical protein [Tanacetum cinerariifolium]
SLALYLKNVKEIHFACSSRSVYVGSGLWEPTGDITRLQALVDKKRIMITEEVVCEILVGKGFSGVETPLFESMLAVRVVAEEAGAQVPAQGDDVQEHVAEEVATDVVPPTPTSPSPSSPVIPFSPPHQPPCPPQPQDAEGSSLLFQQVLDTCFALVLRVEGLENDKVAQQLEIVKLKARVKKLEKINKVKSSKLRRLKKVGTSQRIESSDDVENAEIYNIDLDHSSKVLSMQEDDTEVVASTHIPAAKPKTLTITAAPAVSTRKRKGVVIRDPKEELPFDTPAETPKVKDKGKGILIEDIKPMKKKDQVEMDAEYARKLHEEINKEHEEAYKNIDWNAALDHVQSKEPQYIKRYHGIKKKPKEAQEVDDLKKRLEIVQDEDDDVFVEATPLAQKSNVDTARLKLKLFKDAATVAHAK